jgi:hypothetical protein
MRTATGGISFSPGYTKSLVEDGFRTYGGAGNVTLDQTVSAVNTRAGFEIGARRTTATAQNGHRELPGPRLRAWDICSARHVVVRRSRGNLA